MIEQAYTPDVRGAFCTVSFTLDLISWFRAEQAVCEPCHLTWSVQLLEEANESYERRFGVSILSRSIGISERVLDAGRGAVENSRAFEKKESDPLFICDLSNHKPTFVFSLYCQRLSNASAGQHSNNYNITLPRKSLFIDYT